MGFSSLVGLDPWDERVGDYGTIDLCCWRGVNGAAMMLCCRIHVRLAGTSHAWQSNRVHDGGRLTTVNGEYAS